MCRRVFTEHAIGGSKFMLLVDLRCIQLVDAVGESTLDSVRGSTFYSVCGSTCL